MLSKPPSIENPTYKPHLLAKQPIHSDLPPTHNYMLTNPLSTDPPTYTKQLHAEQPNFTDAPTYTPQIYADQTIHHRPYHLQTTNTYWPNNPVQALPPTHHKYMLNNPYSTDNPTYTPQFLANQTINYRPSLLRANYLRNNPFNIDAPN